MISSPTLTRSILTALLCGTSLACGPGKEEPVLVISEEGSGADMDGVTGKDMKSPSSDARCQGQTCSGHGSCQVIGNSPLCVCDADYQANGLECEELPAGAPRITQGIPSPVRLTQGESVRLSVKVRHEGEASARIRHVDPDDPSYTEDLFDMEGDGQGTFTLELSWELVNEAYSGIYLKEERAQDRLELYIEDEQGRVATQAFELELHCDGKGGSACEGTCVDLSRDPDNCGRCDKPTPDGATCQAGERVCDQAGLVACDEACVPSDEENCGRCGNTCWEGASCSSRGFCDFSERYNKDTSFRHATLVTEFGTAMVYFNTTYGRFIHLRRYDNFPWSDHHQMPTPTDHELYKLNGSFTNFLVESTALLSHDLGDMTFAYVVSESLVGEYAYDARVYTYDFDSDTSTWSMPRLVDAPNARAFLGTDSQVRLIEDRQGIQRLAYRARNGFEFYKREGIGKSWQKTASLPHVFTPGEEQESTSFGFTYDVLTGAHHIVFADASTYRHAYVQAGQTTWNVSLLDTSNVNIYRTNVSKLFQGPDGLLHVVYRVNDQLVYRVHDPASLQWSTIQPVTPPTPDYGALGFDPLPEGFDMDEQGNRWVLATAGYSIAGNLILGKQLNLFSRRYDDDFWRDELVGGGSELYYGSNIVVDSFVEYDGGVDVHMIVFDEYNHLHTDDTWSYTVHSY